MCLRGWIRHIAMLMMDEESGKGQQPQKKAPIHTFISMKLIICCLIAPRAFWTLPCVLGKKGASHKSFKTTTPKTSWPVHHWAPECWKAAFRPVPVGDAHNDAFCVVGESQSTVFVPPPTPPTPNDWAFSAQTFCPDWAMPLHTWTAHANTGTQGPLVQPGPVQVLGTPAGFSFSWCCFSLFCYSSPFPTDECGLADW